jgi:hypothetical protein
MNHEGFEHVFNRQIEQSREVLLKKAREYASDEDRLHNFKIAAALTQETPEQALWGFLVKHLVSLSDMIVTERSYSEAVWDEKIGDSINYLILLRAQIMEKDASRVMAELDLPPNS